MCGWKTTRAPADLLAALRGGRLFGVFGDLIDALEFKAQGQGKTAVMGGDLQADQGEQVTVTIRFHSPDRNNYEYPLESGHLARFTSNDWTVDEDGFAEITHTLTVTGDQYLRLRGTNVSVETAGETVDGEPLPDQKVGFANDAARFDAINARNYNDLWFYSNPIFVSVGE